MKKLIKKVEPISALEKALMRDDGKASTPEELEASQLEREAMEFQYQSRITMFGHNTKHFC